MKSKLTATIASFFVLAFTATAVIFTVQPAYADDGVQCAVLPQSICSKAKDKPSGNMNSSNSAILSLLEWVIGILSGGVGVAAVAAFIYAGVMYSSADGSAEKVKKAKDIMVNTVIGLVTFAAMAIAIEWLIPGGVF